MPRRLRRARVGVSLLVAVPAAGIAGLTLLGAGTSFLLPLTVSAAGNLEGETAPAVARVATLGCLGSFTGPALIGALAGALDLTSPWACQRCCSPRRWRMPEPSSPRAALDVRPVS